MVTISVKSPIPTLIATLVTGTFLTVVTTSVYHIAVDLDNIQKSFWFIRIVFCISVHNVKNKLRRDKNNVEIRREKTYKIR